MINSIEDILPKNIYLNNQIIINNKRLTNREMDVIACLIGGRSNKKIASFLGVSPKTIENHIHNIMLKLGCVSRESIIDFLEKSAEFSSLKEHYLNILIKGIFESELKKISGLIKKKDLNCLNIYYNAQQQKPCFILQIEKHLEVAGFKVFSKLWAKDQMNFCLSKKPDPQLANYIIYNISRDFLEQLKNIDCTLSLEKILKNIATGTPAITIFLLLEQIDHSVCTSIQNSLYSFVDVSEQENYYFFIFEILKRTLLETNIDQSVEEFKKQYKILFDPTSLKKYSAENKLLEIPAEKHNVKSYNRNWIILTVISVFMLVFYVMFGIFDVKKEIQFMKTKLPKIIVYPQNIIEKSSNPPKFVKQQMLLNLPPRNNKFTGRQGDLIQIKNQLNNKKFGITIQVISGIGGIGKTQLATEFAYTTAEEANYAAILWVAAETSSAMYNSYKKFADHLQINTENLNVNEIQKLVDNNFAKKYKGSKILFILDNVKQNKDIQKYLAALYEQSADFFAAHILITSRSQGWVESPLILETFSPEEAFIFIKKQLPNEQEASIINLSKILNCFPLALTQAVSYINSHTNIDDYLEAYATKTKDYLNEFSNNHNQYTTSLWKTWDITLSKLSKNGQKILFISAYLDPDDIPINFFSDLTVKERMEAIEDLRKHSLITLINNNKSFKMHRLFQEMVNLTSKSKGLIDSVWLSNTMDLLESKFDFNYLEFDKWNLWKKYLIHAIKIAEHTLSSRGKLFDRGIKLNIKIAMFMTHITRSDPEEITHLLVKLLQLTKKYNNRSDSLLEASINTLIGIVKMSSANEHEEAILYFNKAITIYSKVHTTTTQKEKELINILRLFPFTNHNLNSFDEAKYDQSFTLACLGYMFIYTEKELNTAVLNFNKALELISYLKDIDSIKEAVRYQKINILIHLSKAHIYLGNLILAENSLKISKRLLDQIYENFKQKALSFSILTQSYSHILAQFYSHIGKFKEADQLFSNILNTVSATYSNNEDRINIIKIRMSCNSYISGNIQLAKALLEESRPYWGNLNNSYWHWFSKLNLARIYELEEDQDKALLFTKESVDLAKKYYKEKLRDSMTFTLSRAENWTKKNKGTNIIFWKKTLELTIQLFGENHYQTARYHQLYGQALSNTQQFKKAMEQYEKAMAILKAEEIKHPDLIKFQQQNLKTLQELIKESIPHL